MSNELSQEAKERLEILTEAAGGDQELVHDASRIAAVRCGERPTIEQVLEVLEECKRQLVA